jgi:hypothetical protein
MKDSADKAPSKYGLIPINTDANLSNLRWQKESSTNQIIFDDELHNLEEMTTELVREKAERFVLDLIAGKLFH